MFILNDLSAHILASLNFIIKYRQAIPGIIEERLTHNDLLKHIGEIIKGPKLSRFCSDIEYKYTRTFAEKIALDAGNTNYTRDFDLLIVALTYFKQEQVTATDITAAVNDFYTSTQDMNFITTLSRTAKMHGEAVERLLEDLLGDRYRIAANNYVPIRSSNYS